MSYITSSARRSRRARNPFDSGLRHRADFARQATIAAFGWHHAKALDQADFIDRLPGEQQLPTAF